MFRTLDLHPAWGFETNDRWRVAAHQRDEHLRQTGRNPDHAYHRLWGRVWLILNNCAKLASYVPQLNAIIGIFRVFIMTLDDTHDPEKRAIINRHIYRGLFDVWLGYWQIPLDIFITIWDRFLVESYLNYHLNIPE